MPTIPLSAVIRAILTDDPTLPAGEVIERAKARGVTAADSSIRDTVYNIKSELKKKAAKAPPAPAAARETKAPAVAPPAPATAPAAATDLASMLANVAHVNAVVGTCGGVDHVRQVAELVRACGGVEAFLLHLDLVATVRGTPAA
jgi:hypothetical protein